MPKIGELENQFGIIQARMDRVLDPFMMSLGKTKTKAFEALAMVEGNKDFSLPEKIYLAYHIGRLSVRGELNNSTRGPSEKLFKKLS